MQFRYDDEPTTIRFARDSNRMLRDIWRVRMNAWRKRYDAANSAFAFPEEDQWVPAVHTPAHGVPASRVVSW